MTCAFVNPSSSPAGIGDRGDGASDFTSLWATRTVTCGASMLGATMTTLSTTSMTDPVMTSPFLSVKVVWEYCPFNVADGSRMDCRMKSRVYFDPTPVRSGASPDPWDSAPRAWQPPHAP